MIDGLTDYIIKHSKNHNKKLKYDFMPALLEIIERPSHKAGTIIIIGVLVVLITTIVWACLSRLDIVVTASGNMQPKGGINVVKSYTAGTVKQINVTEGAHVKAGDIIIELDPQIIEIDVNQLLNQKEILTKQKYLYLLILEKDDVSNISINVYPEDQKPYIRAILEEYNGYVNSIKSYEKEKENIDLSKQIATIQLEAYKSYDAETEIEKQELVIQQYDVSIEKLDIQISGAKVQYIKQVNTALSQIITQINEIDKSLESYKLSKEYQSITAPVDGYINTLNVNTLGETVTSAQELVTIVPEHTPLEMVCYVKNMDISSVELGMDAEIKLETYPYNKYGTIKGKVSYINPSAFSHEQLGSIYVVKVQITDKNENVNIVSGLTGTVEIKTGNRTVMDYFLEPIVKGFGESLKER